MTSRPIANQEVPDRVAPFRPVEQPRLYVVIARAIAEQIRGAPLAAGTQLPPERDLAKHYQVSRTTLREAMIALETMGMVEVRVGDGTYVADPGPMWRPGWDGNDDPGPGPHEQFRVRAVVECAAAQDAAMNITGEELAALDGLLAAMQADIDGPDAEAQRREFHAIIARASRNSILNNIIVDLWRLRSSAMWRTIRGRVARASDHLDALRHRRAIHAALERRDGPGAAAAMGQLMDSIRQRYFSALEE
jgi:DNA-binding FadR family transcriptional regulator